MIKGTASIAEGCRFGLNFILLVFNGALVKTSLYKNLYFKLEIGV